MMPTAVSRNTKTEHPSRANLKRKWPADAIPSTRTYRDSGFEGITKQQVHTPDRRPKPRRTPMEGETHCSIESSPDDTPSPTVWSLAVPTIEAHHRYPGLILQPDSSPISQDQLAAEVKGIYAGLVMVEAKCIDIDAAQATDTSTLGKEQWQALIALHRTLLYEHHDFLMAIQHPSATPTLRGLATKYTMPARMWKHGILEAVECILT
ncbi:hypothetical protein LTR36_002399 [Oleoguttula mirabilis]|uniref:Uncharacterized protein n=1 Tax=Oleoguttula mirabilis TaxID=1507867 RepID=A0AAV9JMU6_9PEZI|nr:hypothetical protein LTR36_002399 [Oleoguttula mirabilis]